MPDKDLSYIIYVTVMYVSYFENSIILQYEIIRNGRLLHVYF